MSLIRQLEAEHKPLWDKISQHNSEMEKEQDCDPSLLSGWTDRDLSLWEVSSNERKPQLNDILIAICRNKKNWEKISYILFPKETVSLSGLILTPCNGKTGDQIVDISGTHFEIKEITGKKLCTLIFHVSRSDFKTGTFKKSEMEKILFKIYDSTIMNQVVNGATAQTPNMNIPASGSGVQGITVTSGDSGELSKGYPLTEQIPSSSTAI